MNKIQNGRRKKAVLAWFDADPVRRYTQEAANMGRKLTRLNYEKQIIDLEWRRTSAGRTENAQSSTVWSPCAHSEVTRVGGILLR